MEPYVHEGTSWTQNNQHIIVTKTDFIIKISNNNLYDQQLCNLHINLLSALKKCYRIKKKCKNNYFFCIITSVMCGHSIFILANTTKNI